MSRRFLYAFSLLELVAVLGIVSVIAALAYPVYLKASASVQTLKCLKLRQELYVGAKQFMDDFNLESPAAKGPLTMEMDWWKDALKPYEIQDKHWYCPAFDRAETNFASDFFYVGCTPWDFKYASDKFNLYLFVERQIVHGDVNVVVMADGTVRLEALVGF